MVAGRAARAGCADSHHNVLVMEAPMLTVATEIYMRTQSAAVPNPSTLASLALGADEFGRDGVTLGMIRFTGAQ